MLHDPALHEQLTDRAWDEARVRDAVARIVAATAAAYDPDAFWRAHECDGWNAALPLKNLYVGAAGVAWGLARLGDSPLDPARVAARALERFREEPDYLGGTDLPPQKRSALLFGETGVALVAHLLSPSAELRDLLVRLIRANLGNEANELMWGVPGTLLAARAIGADEAARESESALRAARGPDGYWTQRLYGNEGRLLGPPHGLVGNVAALGDVGNAAEILARAAVREGRRANWPSREGSESLVLQWCHGAPGIVATATAYLDEELLLAGAQLVWDAGPPLGAEKGSGLCHGTAGNGYALLKTFERTRDERWLERARAFAVHALEQAQSLPARHSLFTGGIGAALFAADCLRAEASFPVLDSLSPIAGERDARA